MDHYRKGMRNINIISAGFSDYVPQVAAQYPHFIVLHKEFKRYGRCNMSARNSMALILTCYQIDSIAYQLIFIDAANKANIRRKSCGE